MAEPAIGGEPCHLFVYGTLRSGSPLPLARVLAGRTRCVGEGWVEGTLYDLGLYPALTPEGGGRVSGEVLELLDPQGTLDTLDAYEGARPGGEDPPLFRRERRAVELSGGGALEAWCYLFARPLPPGARRIPGEPAVWRRSWR